MWGGGVACLSSDSCACLEVGPQGACAVHEGEDIHVFVASVVCAVYKAGLGGGADFVEKGSGCQCGGVGGILVFNGLGQYGSGFGLQLFYGVGAASGAFFGGAILWPVGVSMSMSKSLPRGESSSMELVIFFRSRGSASTW